VLPAARAYSAAAFSNVNPYEWMDGQLQRVAMSRSAEVKDEEEDKFSRAMERPKESVSLEGTASPTVHRSDDHQCNFPEEIPVRLRMNLSNTVTGPLGVILFFGGVYKYRSLRSTDTAKMSNVTTRVFGTNGPM